jgi:hypothetical protein
VNKAEYRAYVETVERYLKGIECISTGPSASCDECRSNFGIKEHDPDECGCEYLGNNTWSCGHIDGEDNTDEIQAQMVNESSFSWEPCEICGACAGDREEWHGFIDGMDAKMVHGTCCTDCAYFINMGRLDDTTMWEVEHSPEPESEVDE